MRRVAAWMLVAAAGCLKPVPADPTGFKCDTDSDCSGGTQCARGTCRPRCANCAGCCQADGTCLLQTGDSACGTGGNACLDCGPDAGCNAGTCQALCASSCPGGCCDVRGNCLLGIANNQCGTDGGFCADCGAGVCLNGACAALCDAGTCTFGCCDPSGLCHTETDALCGQNVACFACTAAAPHCWQGECTHCNPQTCPAGCCDVNDTCVTPQPNDSACGVGGVDCQACTGGLSCKTTGRCGDVATCDITTCSGCCLPDGGCLLTPSQQDVGHCGYDGAACAACTASQPSCYQGQCQ